MKPAIFKGRVHHYRRSPREHKFSYSLYLTWIPEQEIEKIFTLPGILAHGKLPAFIKYKRSNYLAPKELSLKDACALKLKQELDFEFDGEVCLVSNLQYFGICYNPVSFYYCYDKSQKLQAIIAEINNTPWNQRHSYCIDMRTRHTTEFAKDFHISPFMPMDIDYKWHFNSPDNKLAIHMQNFHEDRLLFDATMNLEKVKFSRIRLLWLALIYPLMPVKVIFGIYWQAILLKIKKIPFYNHPKTGDEDNERNQTEHA